MKKTLMGVVCSFTVIFGGGSVLASDDLELIQDEYVDIETGIDNPSNLIEPLGIPGDSRSCTGKFYSADGESYVTMQTNTTSVNRSLQWSFLINSSAYKLYSPQARVMMTPAFVNGIQANSPYSPHTQSPSYNFHGSMKYYQVSGQNKVLKAGDRVRLFWRGTNPTNAKNTTSVLVECKVL